MFAKRVGYILDGGDLRHAHSCNNARGADRARADSDLYSISSVVNQGLGGGSGSDIAADDLDLGKPFLYPLYPVKYALRMSMRSIHHDDIHACFG